MLTTLHKTAFSLFLCVQAAALAQPGAAATRPALMPPLPVWPADGETLTERRPLFRFNGRHGASRYRIELARTREFVEPLLLERFRVSDDSGIEPAVTAQHEGEPLADATWYWRVFAAGEDGAWTPAANYRTFRVANSDPDAVVAPAQPVHPRLLLTKADILSLRSRIAGSAHLQRGWRYLYNAAAGMLEAEPPDEQYARSGEGQHGYYNAAANWYHRHLDNMAFVACVSGEQRFIDKGVEMLMTACGYQRWLGPLFDNPKYFDPPWHAALETAMTTHAVATAYDLLHEHLTDEQRAVVRAAIADKGVRPLVQDWADPIGSSRLPRHQIPTGNWVVVCSASAGVGALTLLGEHEEAPTWVRTVTTRMRAWLLDRGGDYCVDNPYPTREPGPKPVIGPSEPNFGADGGYKESISYMNYAMQYVCYYGDALQRTTGRSIFAHIPPNLLEPLAWSVIAWPEADQVRSFMFDFGDSGSRPNYYDLYGGLMTNLNHGRARWLYERTVPVPLSPRSLVWYDDRVVESPPVAPVPMTVFRDIGQVICRAGWSPQAPAGAIKFHQNRGHLDLGTFILFGGGHPTITDSGVTAYNHDVYRSYSSQSIAHNVVLVDGKPQARTNGRLLGAVATSHLSGASGQLAPAYPGVLDSWTRDLVMLPDNRALIVDQLEAGAPHQYDLLLHPFPPFQMEPPFTLVIGNAATPTRITVTSTVPLAPVLQEGYHENQTRRFVRFASAAPSAAQSFVTLCTWPTRTPARTERGELRASGDGRWTLDREDAGSRLAVRIGGATDDRIRTDARVAVVYESGRRRPRPHVLVLAARQLVVDGVELLRSTVPVNAGVEFDLPLRAHVWTDEPAQLTLVADAQIHEVRRGTDAVPVRWHEGTLTFELPAGESELMGSELPRPLGRPNRLIFDDLLAVTAPEDAPAFRPGMIAASSTAGQEGLQAIDGDANTAWMAMPGAPLPQWLEIRLAKPESMGRISIDTGQACTGFVEIWNGQSNAWRRLGPIRTRADATIATVLFTPVETQRIRVHIESVEASGSVPRIHSLEWGPGLTITTAPPAATVPTSVGATAPVSQPAQSPRRYGSSHSATRTAPSSER